MPSNNASSQSFHEGLKKILGDVAQLSLAPDADLQFCLQIQAMITQHVKQGLSQAFGGQMSPEVGPGPLPGQEQAQQGQGGPGGPPPQGMGGGMPGLAVDPANMDELRRTLGNTGRAA